eukprot:TRINITY_DN3297_c0_g1_i1.p1 TRINITY_DN3297_c0_g1~~TRINITY_DN3297_c0_g1_i1.p1  ORF type:complete len:223 (+),score=14.84 TRINITY_DN3297_c0_g1_i1:82-750(+)
MYGQDMYGAGYGGCGGCGNYGAYGGGVGTYGCGSPTGSPAGGNYGAYGGGAGTYGCGSPTGSSAGYGAGYGTGYGTGYGGTPTGAYGAGCANTYAGNYGASGGNYGGCGMGYNTSPGTGGCGTFYGGAQPGYAGADPYATPYPGSSYANPSMGMAGQSFVSPPAQQPMVGQMNTYGAPPTAYGSGCAAGARHGGAYNAGVPPQHMQQYGRYGAQRRKKFGCC